MYFKLKSLTTFSTGKNRCEKLGMRLGIYPTDVSIDVLNELRTRFDNAKIWVDLVKHSVTRQPMWGGDNGQEASENDYTTNAVTMYTSGSNFDAFR